MGKEKGWARRREEGRRAKGRREQKRGAPLLSCLLLLALTEHLPAQDRLGVERHELLRLSDHRLRKLARRHHNRLEGLLQARDDLGLASAGRADKHERVAHEAHLVDLDDLVDPIRVLLQVVVADCLARCRLHERVLHLGGLEAGEEVLDERQEERHVLGHILGEVHVAERAHHEHGLGGAPGVLAVVALGGAARAQHGEDVAQAEVVVGLLGQLLLAERVEHVELLGADGVLLVAGAGQLDLHDDLAIGHHCRTKIRCRNVRQ